LLERVRVLVARKRGPRKSVFPTSNQPVAAALNIKTAISA
jgi:hypothetical protein